MGTYVFVGGAGQPGLGLVLGSVSAHALYTRDLLLISDLKPAFRSSTEQTKVAAMVGFSVRIFGFERLVGKAGYRGFDIDVGFRVGPGLSFSTRDSRVDKNRRFVLVVDPAVRISRTTGRWAYVAEFGATTPHIRIGMWIPW